MKIVIISDVHANLNALKAVLLHAKNNYNDFLICNLGDSIDYGMRPNETLELLHSINSMMMINLTGNHEKELLGHKSGKFSSLRGLRANEYTMSILKPSSLEYIKNFMHDGCIELKIYDKEILFVHGDLSDKFWGNMSNEEKSRDVYQEYDYVISGHTHIPCFHEMVKRTQTESGRSEYKKTIFINPGSVGQPRNLKPFAQYAVIDFDVESVHFNSVAYDIDGEIALYNGEIDHYYAERLRHGI